MSAHVMKFIAVVGIHFPPPKASDETQERAWLASMIRSLSGYSSETLAEAAEEIVSTRTRKDGWQFPLPSECRAVCERVAHSAKTVQGNLLAAPGRDFGEWSSDRVNLADDLMKTEMGLRAAKEGWHRALWNFARQKGRLPVSDEIQGVQRASKAFLEAYRKCCTGEAGEHSQALKGLGDAMLEKSRRQQDEILGGNP